MENILLKIYKRTYNEEELNKISRIFNILETEDYYQRECISLYVYNILKIGKFNLPSKIEKIDYKSIGLKNLKLVNVKLDEMIFSYKNYGNIKSQMIGFDQMKYIASAIEVIEILKEEMSIKKEEIYSGIYNTKIPLVYETLNLSPLVIVDRGDNQSLVKSMVDNIVLTLDRQRVRFVFGVSENKDYEEMINLTYLRAVKYYLVSPKEKLDTDVLKKNFDKRKINYEEFLNIKEGLEKAISDSNRLDAIVVFGSKKLALDAKDIGDIYGR